MTQATIHLGFKIRQAKDFNTKQIKYIGINQFLRLTADTHAELIAKIDKRLDTKVATKQSALKRAGVSPSDNSEFYYENYEVDLLVAHTMSHGIHSVSLGA